MILSCISLIMKLQWYLIQSIWDKKRKKKYLSKKKKRKKRCSASSFCHICKVHMLSTYMYYLRENSRVIFCFSVSPVLDSRLSCKGMYLGLEPLLKQRHLGWSSREASTSGLPLADWKQMYLPQGGRLHWLKALRQICLRISCLSFHSLLIWLIVLRSVTT